MSVPRPGNARISPNGVTRFLNAMRLTIILGGSTNAVLHSIAMARAFDIPLTIDDWQKVSDETPFLADLKPSGKYVMEDLHAVGGAGEALARHRGSGYRSPPWRLSALATSVRSDTRQRAGETAAGSGVGDRCRRRRAGSRDQ